VPLVFSYKIIPKKNVPQNKGKAKLRIHYFDEIKALGMIILNCFEVKRLD